MTQKKTKRPSGYEYVRKQADDLRADKMKTEAEMVALLKAKFSHEELVAAYREVVKAQSGGSLDALIESVIFNPSDASPQIGPQVRGVEKAVNAEPDLHDAIAKALTPSGRQTRGDASILVSLAHERMVDEQKKPTKKEAPKSRVRQNIENNGDLGGLS